MDERVRPGSTVERYRERFSRVLRHIETRSEEALCVEELSRIAAFSRHHFHRQFSAFLGMSAYRYVQFMRMRRASWRLAFRPEMSVGDIALATGYEGPEAFARAFRQFSGQSPSGFRTTPDWHEWHSRFRPFIELRHTHMIENPSPEPVRIVQFPTTRVARLQHRGNPLALGDSIRRFVEWRKAHRLPPKLSATFNLVYDDPDAVPPEEFRLDLCAATTQTIASNDAGISEYTIPSGRCALLRHVGPDDQLGRCVLHLYAKWLPGSGEELRDFPLFMERLAFFPDVPDSEAITDIYLPLR
jgi:AraC family transcriptional regulator